MQCQIIILPFPTKISNYCPQTISFFSYKMTLLDIDKIFLHQGFMYYMNRGGTRETRGRSPYRASYMYMISSDLFICIIWTEAELGGKEAALLMELHTCIYDKCILFHMYYMNRGGIRGTRGRSSDGASYMYMINAYLFKLSLENWLTSLAIRPCFKIQELNLINRVIIHHVNIF